MVSVLAFRKQVWVWYRSHGRHSLPWRQTQNPYRVLVSEVMLQQTQVPRVLPKYAEFVHSFPNVRALARAPLRKLLNVWQGLGYNRRALNLRRAVQAVVGTHHGTMPKRVAELEQLPGVGPYTARAVANLAFNQPVALLETNIRKVILHHFFPRRKKVTDREVVAIAEHLLDAKRPREWNLALMDYGAAHFNGRVQNPNLRSAHYTKQSAFKGSRRFVRGKVVAFLSQRGSVSRAELRRYLKAQGLTAPELAQLSAVLAALSAEGLVVHRRTRYSLSA